MSDLSTSEREREALKAHKNDLDDVTFWRWMRRLPFQYERLKALPQLARAIADEAEALAASKKEAA